MKRPSSAPFDEMTLLQFARQYSMPRTPGSVPSLRNKHVIIIPRPYCSPDPAGPNYEQYCRHSLMQYKNFRVVNSGYATFADAYVAYLESGNIPNSLQDDIHRLQKYNESHEEQESYQVLLLFNTLHMYTMMVHVHACTHITHCNSFGVFRNMTSNQHSLLEQLKSGC